MPSSEDARIVDLITRQLGPNADPSRVGLVALRVWSQIEAELQPIIGSGGVSALFARSVFVTARRYPKIQPVPDSGALTTQLDALHGRLKTLSGSEATEVATVLLQSFHQLLTSMVGPKLTAELLRSVWDMPANDTPATDA